MAKGEANLPEIHRNTQWVCGARKAPSTYSEQLKATYETTKPAAVASFAPSKMTFRSQFKAICRGKEHTIHPLHHWVPPHRQTQKGSIRLKGPSGSLYSISSSLSVSRLLNKAYRKDRLRIRGPFLPLLNGTPKKPGFGYLQNQHLANETRHDHDVGWHRGC